MPSPPETRYTKSGDVNIAYQVLGEGPPDLVYVPGWISHVELAWELPDLARGFERLASFSRLMMFDKRGTGMSDAVPPPELPTLEQRMDDVRAVMDAVGSERAAIFGASDGGQMQLEHCRAFFSRRRSQPLEQHGGGDRPLELVELADLPAHVIPARKSVT